MCLPAKTASEYSVVASRSMATLMPKMCVHIILKQTFIPPPKKEKEKKARSSSLNWMVMIGDKNHR